MFNPELANVLPNGAIILDRRHIGETWVWLADFHGSQPYVTWVSDDTGETVWGRYFERYDDAYENFCERIQRQWELQGVTCLS